MPAVISSRKRSARQDGTQSNSVRRLWVTWQHPTTRLMHLVGCLESLPDGDWSFWYVKRALAARDFKPFAHFPDLGRRYWSHDIFPVFANRVMSPRRSDYGQFLTALDLTNDATPFDILARSSGDRATDSIRLHPEPEYDHATTMTRCRFLVHGIRHVDGAAERIEGLKPGDRLTIRPEPTNPVNSRAMLLDVLSNQPVGYVPDLLLDYVYWLREYRGVEARIERVNPPPAPVSLRLLCMIQGSLPPGPTPFMGPDFEPLYST